MSPEQIELQLTGMAYGGDAFGRDSEGRMIFVGFGLPGEQVQVQLTDIHKRWARGHITNLIKQSPQRIDPECPYFGQCGGCQYQHLAYPQQCEVKQIIVSDQLHRIGHIPDAPVQKILPSPSPWNTRNKARFAIDENGQLAFHGVNPNELVAIDTCPLLEPDLNQLRTNLDFESIPGLHHVMLRNGSSGPMIILESDADPDIEMNVDFPASVVWMSPDGYKVLAGSDHLLQEIKELSFLVTSGSFFRVNNPMAERLVDKVLALVNVHPPAHILDLYAGTGFFSRFLAERGFSITAIEDSPWACLDFEVNLDPYAEIALYEAAVEIALPEVTVPADIIIVDPPLSGISPAAMHAILAKRAARIIYISCDPATMARDARTLHEFGYELLEVTPFDTFPHTQHIETVSVWDLLPA